MIKRKRQAALSSISLIRQAEANDCTPLGVMIDNLDFWHHRARELEVQLSELPRPIIDSLPQLVQLLRMLLDARAQSQAIAVDAAPYFHPRLSSVAITSLVEREMTAADRGSEALGKLAALTEEDLIAEYQNGLAATAARPPSEAPGMTGDVG